MKVCSIGFSLCVCLFCFSISAASTLPLVLSTHSLVLGSFCFVLAYQAWITVMTELFCGLCCCVSFSYFSAGPPCKLAVSPGEDGEKISVEAGESLEFQVQIEDAAGNPASDNRMGVACKVSNCTG